MRFLILTQIAQILNESDGKYILGDERLVKDVEILRKVVDGVDHMTVVFANSSSLTHQHKKCKKNVHNVKKKKKAQYGWWAVQSEKIGKNPSVK